MAQDPVQNAMGNFGIWHLWIALALSLVNFPVAWHQLSIVFLAPPTRFGCLSSVHSNSTVEILLDDQCVTNNNGTEEKCIEFEYDRSVFKDSIITEVWSILHPWHLIFQNLVGIISAREVFIHFLLRFLLFTFSFIFLNVSSFFFFFLEASIFLPLFIVRQSGTISCRGIDKRRTIYRLSYIPTYRM